MATLTLRVDDDVRDRLHAFAEGRGLSVSDVVRSLIDGLFDRPRVEARSAAVPESMTAVDRQQLALLHRILARLVEDRSADQRLVVDGDTAYQLDRAEALEAGWSREYDREFHAMSTELSRRDCGLVMDLLDMFRTLRRSMGAVPGRLAAGDVRALSFRGFDARDRLEGRMLDYARWLVAQDGRWGELEGSVEPDDGWVAPAPRLSDYQQLLAAYEPLRHAELIAGGLLAVDDLLQIVAAVS